MTESALSDLIMDRAPLVCGSRRACLGQCAEHIPFSQTMEGLTLGGGTFFPLSTGENGLQNHLALEPMRMA